MNIYLFSHTSSELVSYSTVFLNVDNIKGAGGFDSKFPFDCVVILEDLLSNKVIIINLPLIAFQKGIAHKCFSNASDGLPFHNEKNVQENVKGKCKDTQTYLWHH